MLALRNDDIGEEDAMPTPFPGMDPYLEQAGLWEEVHSPSAGAPRSYVGAS